MFCRISEILWLVTHKISIFIFLSKIGARFINLQVSTLVDKWYGESQKRAEAVFSLVINFVLFSIFIISRIKEKYAAEGSIGPYTLKLVSFLSFLISTGNLASPQTLHAAQAAIRAVPRKHCPDELSKNFLDDITLQH